MPLRRSLLLILALAGGAASAQQPAPAGMALSDSAARRFPQPVRVGDLIGREVLRPVESQPTLGRIRALVKQPDGSVAVVMGYGGVLGWFARPIAVPVEAMALLGQYMEVVDFTPQQLGGFETFDAASAAPLPPDSIIRVGLARPSH